MLNLLSARALNLDQSKILLFGKELSPCHLPEFLNWTKFKAFEEDKINIIERLKQVS